jgi:hypothetical protein
VSETLASALVNAQAAMPAVAKTAKAVYGKYATLDEIIERTRPVLNEHGLSITQFPEVTELGAPGLRTTITHTSGESVSSLMPLLLVKQDMQSLGSAITYARRYAWAAALGIAADADDDGAHATRPKASAEEPKAASKGAPPKTPAVSQAPAPIPGEPASSADDSAPFTARFEAAQRAKGGKLTKDQEAKIGDLIVETAELAGKDVIAATETLERDNKVGSLSELSEAQAAVLIGKLERYRANLKKQKAAA